MIIAELRLKDLSRGDKQDKKQNKMSMISLHFAAQERNTLETRYLQKLRNILCLINSIHGISRLIFVGKIDRYVSRLVAGIPLACSLYTA